MEGLQDLLRRLKKVSKHQPEKKGEGTLPGLSVPSGLH